MWQWVLKFLSGVIPGQKPFGEWSGKILWVVLIFTMCTGFINVWERFFPPKPNVINVAGDYTPGEKMVAHFECSAWRANARIWYSK